MTPRRSSSLTALLSPKRLRRLGSLSGQSEDPSNMGTSLYIPYRSSLARRSSGHQQHGGTQCCLSSPPGARPQLFRFLHVLGRGVGLGRHVCAAARGAVPPLGGTRAHLPLTPANPLSSPRHSFSLPHPSCSSTCSRL